MQPHLRFPTGVAGHRLTFTCHSSCKGGGFVVCTEHTLLTVGTLWVLAHAVTTEKKKTLANTSARQNKKAAILNLVV